MLVRTVLIFRKLTIWKGNWRLWKKNNWGVQWPLQKLWYWILWDCCVKTDESCDRLTLASFVTQLRNLCQMEGGQCCYPCAVSTFYLKNSTCKRNHTGLLCYLLLEFLWTCFLIFPAQPLPWQLVSSPAKFKDKSFKMLLFYDRKPL